MTGGGRMVCVVCGKDISFAGAPICPTCDSDLAALIERGEKTKTPRLCEEHYRVHLAAHEAKRA